MVDGDAEFYSLASLNSRLVVDGPVLGPIRADIQPTAPAHHIARVIKGKLGVLLSKKVERVVILIDREQIPSCAGARANELQNAIAAVCAPPIPVSVVIKNRTFENWLIADIAALRQYPKRFKVSAGLEGLISPNKADHVDGLNAIKKAVIGDYDKVKDAARILAVADPLAAARNSRSFRRYLRVLGLATYAQQSATPAQ